MGAIRYVLLLLFPVIACLPTFGQDRVADSLFTVLSHTRADTNRVKVLNEISYYYFSSDTGKAENYRKQAERLATQLHYTNGLAFSAYLKGRKYNADNNYVLAINSQAEAIKIAQKTGDYATIARAYNAMGLYNIRLEDIYNARNSFERALAALERSPDKSVRAGIIHNLGTLEAKQKNYEAALGFFEEAVGLNTRTGNQSWLAQNYLEIGEVYEKLGNNKKAIQYANKAFSLARETSRLRVEINSLLLLGKVYTTYGRYPIAKRYLDAGFKLLTDRNLQGEKLAFYKEYSNFYAKQNLYQQAYTAEKAYATLYDRLYNVGQNKLVLEFQEQFKSQEREAENALLKKEQANNADKLKQQNQLLVLSLILGVFFFGCTILFLIGNRRIRMSNTLLKLQKSEIQAQKDKVEHLNSIKDKLFSVISHDLRSPFASLKNMMDLYEEGMISKDDVDFFFKEIRKDIGSNSMLLDNLLIWSKSQLEGFTVRPQAIAMRKLFEEVVYLNLKKISNKELQVRLEVAEGFIASADYEMTKSVVRNLLGNAIKFTPKTGIITISAVQRGDKFEFAVSDAGIGIPEEQRKQLFKDHFVTTYGLEKEKGTGLGLQICKEFVEKNDGQIWVRSNPGEGSTFYFTLPVSEDEQAAPVVSSYESQELEKKQFKDALKHNAVQQQKYDRYELLARATDDTVYDWDLENNQIRWNESLLSNFGYPFETTDFGWWKSHVHPDDLEDAGRNLEEAFSSGRMNWSYEYRFRASDGTYKYVLERGLIIYNEQEKPFRMIGLLQNTQAQKNALNEIQRLSLVAKNVNNLVVITDSSDRIVWVNKAFEKFTGYELSEIAGRVPKAILSGQETDPATLDLIDSSLQVNEPFSTEVVNYKKSGERYWVRIDCTPYNDPVTNQVGYVAIQTVITDRKNQEHLLLKKNEALREIARISSHEVRKPLSSIMGLVQLLKSKLDQKELDECLHLLDISADHLDSLIFRIHDHISEIEREKIGI
ncbi:MAG TPA: ATP-binding protein [Sphingobacteriaceae bacterium]